MNKVNLLLKEIKEIFRRYNLNSSFWRANSGYPRMEYSLNALDVNFADKYVLRINLYDKGTFETINQIADTLDDEVGQATFETEKFYFKFYKNNDRQIIDDADKTIARLYWSYEIRLYWRENPNE